EEFWRTFEVNVLGVHLCCEAAQAAGCSRIVIIGSGASYLPGASNTSYTSSKAAVGRYGETLNNAIEIPVFVISPGMVQTELTSWAPEDSPWTPPELAPELVRKLATGRYDQLAGRYIHAEHDDVDDLLARVDEILEQDLNAIRLRR
ncbi:MAG: SDR family NAD(P)-dependent oxidoreductase, partial [Actinomycetota bacterium]